MIRRLVRRLIAPLARWSMQGAPFKLYLCRSHRSVGVEIQGAFGEEYTCWLGVADDEAQAFARNILRYARDVIEGVPIENADPGT